MGINLFRDLGYDETDPEVIAARAAAVSETRRVCKNCGEYITFNEDYEEWMHRADLSGEEDAFIGEPLCKIPGLTWIETVTEAANGNGIYAEPLSVVGATLPEELCGEPDRNGERCVFLTDHEGDHSWQRK